LGFRNVEQIDNINNEKTQTEFRLFSDYKKVGNSATYNDDFTYSVNGMIQNNFDKNPTIMVPFSTKK